MSYRIYAITDKNVTPISLTGLTPIGGNGTSGVEVAGLKNRGDYAILAAQSDGVAIHRLRGKNSAPQVLVAGEVAEIDDLSVLVMPLEDRIKPTTHFTLPFLSKILASFANEQGAELPLETVLSELIKVTGLEKGLVITKNLSGTYEILVSQNLEKNDAWLSETIVQKALNDRQPMILQNIIGSRFDTKASLVATGFLSVFCWPLIVQGEAVGLIMVGSRKPHSGLTQESRELLETIVSLASLLTHFRLKELGLKRTIRELQTKREDIPLLTDHAGLQETCELARKVATSDLSVLVQGETGVGKEVLSKWIHTQSDRKNGPFIAVNCSSIPHDLLESILFGHRKGAFTGATSDQIGKIQQADRGTLFLDEIGDLPLDLQAKLLRVLQDKMVEPVGATKPIKVDVRFVSATHKSIKDLVAQQKFRDDLYYRINEMTLWIPALRDRPSDIRLLAQNFLIEFGSKNKISTSGMAWLLSQPWNGNTRELKSSVKRALLLAGNDELEIVHFTRGTDQATKRPTKANSSWLGGVTLEDAKHTFVKGKIHQALELTRGNRTKAAELLGVTPRTLFRYLESEAVTELS